MSFNFICAECSEHFETNWAAAKFCGDRCRLKAWRAEQKKNEALHWSVCPYCRQRFPHKNPKKLFCTPKCKTAYHREEVKWAKQRDRYDNSHGYYAPPTPEEQVQRMLEDAFKDADID